MRRDLDLFPEGAFDYSEEEARRSALEQFEHVLEAFDQRKLTAAEMDMLTATLNAAGPAQAMFLMERMGVEQDFIRDFWTMNALNRDVPTRPKFILNWNDIRAE